MSIDVSVKKKIGNFSLDVTFQSEENEVFAILGASGCGIQNRDASSTETAGSSPDTISTPTKNSNCSIHPNCAVMNVDHLMEQQFESDLILNCGDENETQMRLLMDKKHALELSRQETLAIRIPEEALLLLKE